MRQTPTMLVVNDDEAVRKAVSSLVEILGYQVVTMTNMRQALASIQTTIPDAMIWDHQTGKHLLADLVATPNFESVPIRILLTAHELDTVVVDIAGKFTRVVQKQDGSAALIAAVTGH